MTATKTMSKPPPAGKAARKPGKRAVPHRRLHLDPGHSALQEKIGENTGRKTQRAVNDTQHRTKNLRGVEFRTGTAGL